MNIKTYAKMLTVIALLLSFYFLAEAKHQERDDLRKRLVQLTPTCQKKLDEYALKPGEFYISPYLTKRLGREIQLKGYVQSDINAIGRGCNLVDDYHGWLAENGDKDRWESKRYVRTELMNCRNCHRDVGDWKDDNGNHVDGSMGLAVNWSNSGDQYDIFTGILLMPELRLMQCGINSMNGFKPNVLDDLVRDFIAYVRFLSAATGKKMGVRYTEQGAKSLPPSDTLKHGDDFTLGKSLYNEQCAHCHGLDGRGQWLSKEVVYPPLGGPDSFNTDSRNYFSMGIFAGIIQVNMPLGKEGTLTPDEARNIAAYIQTLPRPAGDQKGVMAAAGQQSLMFIMPHLLKLFGRYE